MSDNGEYTGNIVVKLTDWQKTNLPDIGNNESEKQSVGIEFNDDINNGANKHEISEEDFDALRDSFLTYGSIKNITIPPFNMGLYFDQNNNLCSTKYVGIMPLMNRRTKKPMNNSVICIQPRFHISPTAMLKEVFEGDDYYENSNKLSCKTYTADELLSTDFSNKAENNKVLCGILKCAGKVDIKSITNKQLQADIDSISATIGDTLSIFEMIQFLEAAKEVCKKALKRQSSAKEENMNGKVKGRILINKQIKYNLSKGLYHMTYCSYNTMSENIVENQIIKYVLHICGKTPMADSFNEDLMFCNRVLANVPLKICSGNDFTGLKTNGAFRYYKDALNFAKKIIYRYHIDYEVDPETGKSKELLKYNENSRRVEPFFIDMNLLFEYYCRALFKKAINQNNEKRDSLYRLYLSKPSDVKPLFGDDGDILKYYMHDYIPDIVVQYSTKNYGIESSAPLVVIDAKYSDVKESNTHRERTYQVMFYINAMNCNYGGLIGIDTESPIDVANKPVIGNYIYNGNSEKTSKQKLLYIPLRKTNETNETEYVDLICSYLTEIINDTLNNNSNK